MALREIARAKVNLTLRVVGRRFDGYHDIESLAAFARVGDRLSLVPGGPGERPTLRVDGPFAGAIGGNDLVLRAAEEVLQAWPEARAGAFHLIKELPVAAGLGGGSADAAAALRLLARANAGVVDDAGIRRIAAGLGADIPVCLEARAALICGRGEHVTPLEKFPRIPAVLVNPGVALATADVFARLDAAPAAGGERPPEPPRSLMTAGDAAALVGMRSNDLEQAARALAPVVVEVKAALVAARGVLAVGLSGSGPTCFGLFATEKAAHAAADALAAAHPGWWVRPTVLS